MNPQRKSRDDAEEMRANLLRLGNGDGTGGGMSEDWKKNVEDRLVELRTDVRELFNRGLVAVVGLAGLIGGLYVYFNEKFEKVSDRLTAVERKVDTIDGKIDRLLERKDRADQP